MSAYRMSFVVVDANANAVAFAVVAAAVVVVPFSASLSGPACAPIGPVRSGI